MKNKDKFLTKKDREQAFDIFCSIQDSCVECEKKKNGGCKKCAFKWLEQEYNDEEGGGIAKKVEIQKILKLANEDFGKQCECFRDCEKCKYYITNKSCNIVHLLYWLAEHNEIIKKIKEL